MSNISPEKALIFRIVHVDNLPWMLENGLQCRNSDNASPSYLSIGSEEIITVRSERQVPVPPGGSYGDYVPFYFTPYSIMMYNIKSGYGVPKRRNDEILICVTSLHDLRAKGHNFVFTNQHACSAGLEFSNNLADLGTLVDWPLLNTRNFKRDPEDPGKLLRYQAEAMVQGDIPLGTLRGIVCHSESVLTKIRAMISPRHPSLSLKALPGWYF
jgi:hypothetical protein